MGFLDNFEVETEISPKQNNLISKPSENSFLNQFEIEEPESEIGSISQKYESQGDPSIISTGVGDYGGKSYGLYQFSSNIGTLKDFINNSNFSQEFQNLNIGSPSFDRKWKELSENPEFVNEQTQYARNKFYSPLKDHIQSSYNIDIEQSPALKELVFSTAVQFGDNLAKKVFDEALKDIDEINEKDLIDKITEVKSDVGRWFKSSSITTQQSVLDRFEKEREDLYQLIQQPSQEEELDFESVIKQEQPTEITENKKESVLKGLEHAGVAGLAQATEMFYSIPSGAANILYGASNLLNKGINALFGNKVLNEQQEIPKFLTENNLVQIPKKVREEQDKEAKLVLGSEKLIDILKDKNIGKTAEWLGQFVLEQAPTSLSLAPLIAANIPKIITLGLMGAGTAGIKSTENEEKVQSGEITPFQSQIDASLNGITEAIFEGTGEYKVLEGLTNSLKGLSKEGIQQTNNIFKNVLNGFFKGAKQEVPSEVITQFSQDLTDKLTGVNPDISIDDMLNNMFEAGAGSLALGGGIGGITGGLQTTKKLKEELISKQETTLPKEEIQSKSFFGTGSLESFIEKFNSVSGTAKRFMLNKLSDVERDQVQTQLNPPKEAVEARSIKEATIDIPKPEESSERRQNLDYRKKVSEMSFEERASALLTDDLTGIKNRRAYDESEKKPIQGIADVDGLKYANDNLGYDSGDQLLKTIASTLQSVGLDVYRIGGDEIRYQGKNEADLKQKLDKAYDILNEKTIVATKPDGSIVTWKGLGFSYGQSKMEGNDLKTAQDEANEKLHEHKKEREKQGFRAGRGEVPSGISIQTPKKYEDKDNLKKEVISDKENKIGIPSIQRKGKNTQQEKPIEKTSEKEITPSRMVQAPSKIKYSVNDLIKIGQENNRESSIKVKSIVSEYGVSLPKRNTWQSFVLEYAKKHGTSDDIENIQDIINKKSSESVIQGKQKVKQERLKLTGDERTPKQKKKIDVIKEIENESLVEYNPNKHNILISSMIQDEKGNYKPTFINNQYSKALEVETINNKAYLKVKDMDVIQDIETASSEIGAGRMISLDEGKTQNEEGIENIPKIQLSKKESLTQKEDLEEIQSATQNMRKKLTQDLKSGKINQKTYDHGIKTVKAMEQDYGLAKYDEDLSDIQYSKEIKQYDPSKPIEYIQGTKEEIQKGKELAKQTNLIFTGVFEGTKQGDKIFKEPTYMFSDEKTQMTYDVPLNITKEELIQKTKDKVKEFHIRRAYNEVKKIFEKIDQDIPKIEITGIHPETGERFHPDVAGALIRNKEGKQTLIINSNIETENILPTLIHELFGHFGAEKVINYIDPKLGQLARDLFEKDRNSYDTIEIAKNYSGANSTKSLFDWIEKNEETLFSEWLAKNTEKLSKIYFDKNGNFLKQNYENDKSILKKVYDFIEKLVGKLFDNWFKKRASEKEKQILVRAISQRFRDLPSLTPIKKSQIQYAKKGQKSISKKQKLKVYANDRLRLETVQDIQDMQIRYFDFANKHFYSTNRESFKKQIFDLIDKVKEIGDENYNKLLKTIDEFSDWEDAENLYKQINVFKKRHRKILSKDNDKLNLANHKLNSLSKKYNQYLEYQTLKRIKDRGSVDRPTKKGTSEYTNPGEKYQKLLDKHYLDKESFDSGSYDLNDNGKEALKHLKTILTDENNDMFNINNIESVFNEVKEIVYDYQKTFKKIKITKKTDTNQALENIVKQINSLKPSFAKDTKLEKFVELVKKGDLTTTNLEYILNRFDNFKDNGFFTKYIFEPLNKGREEVLKIKHEITDFMQDKLKKIPKESLISMSPSFQSGIIGNIEKRINRKPRYYKFKNENGNEINLNISQKISLYMISKNENGLRHLLNGGISLTNKGQIFKLTAKDLQKIQDDITEDEKIVSDMYFKISEILKEKGNKISNEDIGYDIFTEENYHPLLVRNDYINDDINEIKNLDDLRKYIIKTSPSALKQRVRSNAPIILEGVFEAFSRTSPMIEQYIGTALPSKMVNSILLNKKFKQEMFKKGFDIEYNVIQRLIDDYNGNLMYKAPIGENLFRTFQNLFTTAVLGYKMSVALIQPVSYYSYITSLSQLPFYQRAKIILTGHTGMGGKEFKRIKDLIWKYSPGLRERFEGHGDYAIGEQKKSIEARSRVIGPRKGYRKWLSSEGALEPMIEMDRRTVSMVWKAVEEELNLKGFEKGSEKFYKAVAQKTFDVVRKTQATSDLLDRPAVMNSMILKPLTMFTSEPVKRMMLIRRILMDESFPDKLTNLSLLLIIQPLMIEVLRTGILKARGQDDLPEETEDYLKWFAKRIAINNLGLYPILGTLVASTLSDYDVNLGGPAQEVVNRMVDFSKKTWESTVEGKSWDKTLKSLKRLSAMFGTIQAGEQVKDIIDNLIEQLEE
jgi:GGDEF domain-containing protein